MTIQEQHHQTRRQLTLFIENHVELIEEIRKEFNPVQQELIPAHVTLCREDEIVAIDKVLVNIKSVKLKKELTISFDKVQRFEKGKGVLLPGSSDNTQFHELRNYILKGIIGTPRQHHPHLTLMHPRNSTCTDEKFDRIIQYELPNKLSFRKISLIEQKDGGRWMILREFKIC